MQSQLQALVSKTAELAQQGNPAAKMAIEELEKRGIPIKGAAAATCQMKLVSVESGYC